MKRKKTTASDRKRKNQLNYEQLEAKQMLSANLPGAEAGALFSVVDQSINRDIGDISQEQLIRDHLSSQKESQFLQQGDNDLRVVEIQHGLASTATRFIQTHLGLPVYGANILVNQGPDGTIQNTFNDGVTEFEIAAERFTVTSIELAEDAAMKHAGITRTFADTQGELMWNIDKDGVGHRAWVITVFGADPTGDYLTVIDYATNVVISQENQADFATGDGYVYEPNPWQTQGNGNNLNDANDATNPTLDAERIQVTLLGLDEGTGLLTGEFVDLANLNSTTLPDVDANEPTRVYDYTRDDDRFEQVVIYHSVDSLARYFHTLGFDDDAGTPNGIRDFPTLANAHWDNADNSFYSLGNDAIHFGDGGVDDGEDADIVAHEYGHAVQHDQNANWGGGEMGAMGEGFGDYLAASFYASYGDATFQALHAPAVGEWDATSYSSDDPPNLRRVDGNKMYPQDLVGQVHADGEIWSAALWDMRAAVGQTIADTIILESHFALPGGASMTTGAEQILIADQNIYGGANQGAIRQAFEDRGILEAPQTVGTVSFDKSTYLETDIVNIQVLDANAVLPLSVTVVSDAGDLETVNLTGSAGVFTGTIATAPGAVGTNDGVLNVSLADELTVTYFDIDDGNGGQTADSDTAVVGNVYQFPSGDTPIGINDNSTFTSVINVSQPGNVVDVNVKIDLTHTYTSDLDVFLIGPDGTRVELFSDVGGSGDNMIGTELDQQALDAIVDGDAPFTGVFRPEGNLDAFNGISVIGDWTLEVTDDAGGDTGTLDGWSICVDISDPNMGSVAFDQSSYNPGDIVNITVGDLNATTADIVTVTSSNGDSETLNLAGSGGIFTSSILVDSNVANPGDGLLQGSPGDLITVEYLDVDDGTGNSNLVTDTAGITNIVEYSAADTPIAINDNTTILSTINVPDSGDVADVNVKLDITHTYDGDLDVFLIAPDGTRIELFQDVGGTGENFTGTVLDSESGTPIGSGSAPFTGVFAPVGDLSTLNGMSITGDWMLEITDDAGSDQGTLNSWSICLDVTGGSVNPMVNVVAPAAFMEGDTGTGVTADFVITLSAPASGIVTVDYTTVDGTALAGSDYTASSGIATFQPGDTSVTVSVPVVSDQVTEGDETFSLELSNVAGADPGTLTAVATIGEDDNFTFGDVIDFGRTDTPVIAGGIGVTDLQYSAANGLGWFTSSAINLGTELTQRGDFLVRDRVFVNRGTFVVDIDNGTYDVTLRMGSVVRGGDTIRATIEGVVYNEAPGIGPNVAFTYPVTVNDGQMTFEFNGLGLLPTYRISGIEIDAPGFKDAPSNLSGNDIAMTGIAIGDNSLIESNQTRKSLTLAGPTGSLAGSMDLVASAGTGMTVDSSGDFVDQDQQIADILNDEFDAILG